MPALPAPEVGPAGGPNGVLGAIAFQVLAEIANGETARVDLCRVTAPEDRAGALVAVKRLHPHVADDPTFVKQFLDEVRITHWLRHPNVVEVAGWGNDAEGSYLAVELVQGVSLQRLMKTVFETGEAFNERMVVYVASRICHGLGAAHSLRAPDGQMLNLVHRDLTPGNVLVGFNGEVKIADFGMAWAHQRLTQTLTGMRKGEPTYMAPEQGADGPVDARADLFSLGVMLFELFAGRRPWLARNDLEMLLVTAREPPADLRQIRPKIDQELVTIVNRCLEADRNARWQTAHEIGNRLGEWLSVHGWQEGNEEALGRFVRRNAMRQMRWFERAVGGTMAPESSSAPRATVPTYTEHSGAPGAGSPPDPSRGRGSARSQSSTAKPVDPRSLRAQSNVQALKKLAPPVEPKRAPAQHRNRLPTLDEGDTTDIQVRPTQGAGGLRTLDDMLPVGEDEGGEEAPTLVKREDAGVQAMRAEARGAPIRTPVPPRPQGPGAAVQIPRPGGSQPPPAVRMPAPPNAQRRMPTPPARPVIDVSSRSDPAGRRAVIRPSTAPPVIVADEDSDDCTTGVADRGRPAASAPPPAPPSTPNARASRAPAAPVPTRPPRIHDPESDEQPTAPREAAVNVKSTIHDRRSLADDPPKPAPRAIGASSWESAVEPPAREPRRQAIPPSPVVPQRVPPGTSSRASGSPRILADSPNGLPRLTTSDDDAEVIDRAAIAEVRAAVADGKSPGDAATQEAILAEADRFSIEAVRCAEEARAAAVRAERKAAAAKLAEKAATIAAEAVRVLRAEGIAAARALLEEARAASQGLDSGSGSGNRLSSGDTTGLRDVPPPTMGDPQRVPQTPPMAREVPPPSVPAPSVAPAPHPPRTAVPPAPKIPSMPPPKHVAPAFDPEALRKELKPSGLGTGAAVGGLAVVGALVVVIVLMVLFGR